VKNSATYLLGFISLLLITLFCAFSISGDDSYDLAKQEIILRKIGHEVLLNSGDSTSRVLPVRKIAAGEYQITFENEFTFQTDSLVKIIRRSLIKNNLPRDYIVNVLSCKHTGVLFGYAISGNEKNNIIACSRRKQPKSCYIIDIKFQDAASFTPVQKGYLIGSIPLLAFVGLLLFRSVKPRKSNGAALNATPSTLQIGNTLFDTQKRKLITGQTTTPLTVKECKLLAIFAQSPNMVIERNRLQKEIWEDEGVIVGRSLDMFISKLRKKLESDSSLQLVNIHGTGYKLQISE
jgi:hypothetical protein